MSTKGLPLQSNVGKVGGVEWPCDSSQKLHPDDKRGWLEGKSVKAEGRGHVES